MINISMYFLYSNLKHFNFFHNNIIILDDLFEMTSSLESQKNFRWFSQLSS